MPLANGNLGNLGVLGEGSYRPVAAGRFLSLPTAKRKTAPDSPPPSSRRPTPRDGTRTPATWRKATVGTLGGNTSAIVFNPEYEINGSRVSARTRTRRTRLEHHVQGKFWPGTPAEHVSGLKMLHASETIGVQISEYALPILLQCCSATLSSDWRSTLRLRTMNHQPICPVDRKSTQRAPHPAACCRCVDVALPEQQLLNMPGSFQQETTAWDNPIRMPRWCSARWGHYTILAF